MRISYLKEMGYRLQEFVQEVLQSLCLERTGAQGPHIVFRCSSEHPVACVFLLHFADDLECACNGARCLYLARVPRSAIVRIKLLFRQYVFLPFLKFIIVAKEFIVYKVLPVPPHQDDKTQIRSCQGATKRIALGHAKKKRKKKKLLSKGFVNIFFALEVIHLLVIRKVILVELAIFNRFFVFLIVKEAWVVSKDRRGALLNFS